MTTKTKSSTTKAKSTATKSRAKASSRPAETRGRTAPPVRVDNRTRRSDDDALEGGWVDVVSGEHKGRRGAFTEVVQHDEKDGYPVRILVRTRDEHAQLIPVAYKDVRPARGYSGGR